MVCIRGLQIPVITLHLGNYINFLPSILGRFDISVGPVSMGIKVDLESIANNIVFMLTPSIPANKSLCFTLTGNTMVSEDTTIAIRIDVKSPIGTTSFMTNFNGSISIDAITREPEQIEGIVSIPLRPLLMDTVKPMFVDRILDILRGKSCPINVGPVHGDPCRDASEGLIAAVPAYVNLSLEALMTELCIGTAITGSSSISCQGRDPTLLIPINVSL